MNKPRICKRCKTGIVSEQSWAQSGRLCPPCVEITKTDIIQAIEADTPRLQQLLLDMRQDAGGGRK